MKKLVVAVFAILAVLNLNAQDVKKNINVGAFRTEMNFMLPQRYDSQSITPDYGITVKGDELTVHLPYFGNVDMPSFNNDGLNFTEKLKMDGKVRKNRKDGSVEFRFNTRHGSVSYDFNVTAYDNGSVDIMVRPSNGDSCSYRGEWMPLE